MCARDIHGDVLNALHETLRNLQEVNNLARILLGQLENGEKCSSQ